MDEKTKSSLFFPSVRTFTCDATSCAGVTGIGLDDSKVELYEAADGDRGILAVEVCVPSKHASEL